MLKKIREKWSKKVQNWGKLLVFVVGLRSSFPAKPLLYTAFLSVLTAVSLDWLRVALASSWKHNTIHIFGPYLRTNGFWSFVSASCAAETRHQTPHGLDCGTNMRVVLCCQDHILPSHTLASYYLPCLAFTFRCFVPCLVEDRYRRTAEADSYFPLVGTILFVTVENPI